MAYAVSAGPLEESSARDLVRDTLVGCAAVTVRDRVAQQVLEEAGVQREIRVTADPALLLEEEPWTRRRSVARDSIRTGS